MSERPLLFLAWTKTSGRAEDVASALAGDAVLIYPKVPLLRHPLSTAARYAVSTVLTIVTLVRRRPEVVVVTNPPLIPAVIVAGWAGVTGRRFVLDSHPAGFGLKGKPVLARLQWLHRILARWASGVLVTTDDKAGEIDAWGGHGVVVHEAPVAFPPARPPAEPTVLFVGIFANDEPVDAVVEAARLLPGVTFRITGDTARAPAGLLAASPPNVDYTGFLAPAAYRDAITTASLVLTLTTEPSSVMRSAYEAVYARVPLVVTDTPVLRTTFPTAVFCDNTGPSIAAAVGRSLETLDEQAVRADEALATQLRRWEGQLARLREACGR